MEDGRFGSIFTEKKLRRWGMGHWNKERWKEEFFFRDLKDDKFGSIFMIEMESGRLILGDGR